MLLLCSGSPRRQDFLRNLGLPFEIVPPDIDESRRAGEAVRAYVERMAREKARAGLALFSARATAAGPVVALGADTIVVVRDEVLGKPRDRADARRMLSLLSDSEHVVVTSVCVVAQDSARSTTVETTVRFRTLSGAALEWLTQSGDGDDKAGAYAVQGLAAAFVERIDGSLTSVVGLPLAETLVLLEQAGVALPWSAPR